MDKKIFVSYAHKDEKIAVQVIDALNAGGYQYWIDIEQVFKSEELYTQIMGGIEKADVLLAIITENYLNSFHALAELGRVIISANKLLFTIELGRILMPSYIDGIKRGFYKIDSVDDFSNGIFLDKLNQFVSGRKDDHENTVFENNQDKIDLLKQSLIENRLTLVCGAGVSSSMGLPDWNTLLSRILEYALENREFAEDDMQKMLGSSNLIVGKYLRILLKDEFEKTVAKCLYEDEWVLGNWAYAESRLVKDIVELIRPKRNKGSIESVITFNFDSLLEDLLLKNSIKHKAIYDERIECDVDEIPIYHVHGYLPRNQKLEKYNLVFSEEGYHTQFIDPYSWSNLIQLYKYMNHACLFIGISLSDPNLRRILDIAKRRNPSGKNKHFIIKKMPEKTSSIYNLQVMLEEQDALMLGLNIIWVSNYDEIPLILEKLLK